MGIPAALFWDSSPNEIQDMMESHLRTKNQKRHQEIKDRFALIEALALNIAALFLHEKGKEPVLMQPWDYYSGFEKEKAAYEEQVIARQFQEYQERRKEYIREFNRRKEQGLI